MLYGEWDQYIKHVEARLQERAKLDSDGDFNKTLGKRKGRSVDNEEVLREEN